jgi:hypothetical protein
MQYDTVWYSTHVHSMHRYWVIHTSNSILFLYVWSLGANSSLQVFHEVCPWVLWTLTNLLGFIPSLLVLIIVIQLLSPRPQHFSASSNHHFTLTSTLLPSPYEKKRIDICLSVSSLFHFNLCAPVQSIMLRIEIHSSLWLNNTQLYISTKFSSTFHSSMCN